MAQPQMSLLCFWKSGGESEHGQAAKLRVTVLILPSPRTKVVLI